MVDLHALTILFGLVAPYHPYRIAQQTTFGGQRRYGGSDLQELPRRKALVGNLHCFASSARVDKQAWDLETL